MGVLPRYSDTSRIAPLMARLRPVADDAVAPASTTAASTVACQVRKSFALISHPPLCSRK